MLQKTFTVDFLSKKKKINEGEHPQYYVEHSHEAIIDPREWKLVQLEMERRKSLGMRYSGNCVLATRIVCGDCGSYFGPKVWNSTSKYKRTIWQCNNKFKGETKCRTPHIEEQEIKSRFVSVINTLLPDKQALLEDCRLKCISPKQVHEELGIYHGTWLPEMDRCWESEDGYSVMSRLIRTAWGNVEHVCAGIPAGG